MKPQGRIKAARCPGPGHGHTHMDSAPNGYRCELNADLEVVVKPRSWVKRQWEREAHAEMENPA